MAEIISFSLLTIERIADRIQRAVREGGIVAIPTETYYGLGVDPFNDVAVEGLARVKGRSDRKPILVLIGSLEQLPLVAQVVPPVAKILIEEFWPGSLTILFPARPSLSHNRGRRGDDCRGIALDGDRCAAAHPSHSRGRRHSTEDTGRVTDTWHFTGVRLLCRRNNYSQTGGSYDDRGTGRPMGWRGIGIWSRGRDRRL
jgi:hypothetical protein